MRPAGFQVYLPGRPVDIVLTPDEEFLLVKNKADLDLVRLSDRTVLQSLPYLQSGASFTGLTISHEGLRVYVTDARDRIHVAEMNQGKILQWTDPIILPNPAIGGSPVPGGLILDNVGDKIYVTLSRNNSLAVINLTGVSIRADRIIRRMGGNYSKGTH